MDGLEREKKAQLRMQEGIRFRGHYRTDRPNSRKKKAGIRPCSLVWKFQVHVCRRQLKYREKLSWECCYASDAIVPHAHFWTTSIGRRLLPR